MQEKTKDFIIKNSNLICEYINTKVLKDIGIINPNYFIKVINDNIDENTKINLNLLPYFFFTNLCDDGKVDYTSLRVETINFNKINKEASTYYNYVRFSLKDDFFIVELMQSKIGGMPIDTDIVKFTKKVKIDNSLEEFILENTKK